jgi:hypothetical protein
MYICVEALSDQDEGDDVRCYEEDTKTHDDEMGRSALEAFDEMIKA